MAEGGAKEGAWKGLGMTQEDFMYKDECIVLDENDAVKGHANKYECHRFNETQPRGILHRAFSVFLFDSQNRLLLQQRAKTKITFPSVWTNTCCSHPLYGFSPTEVDTPADVLAGSVPGVKRAAVRKLEHELGITAEQLPVEKFKFMTRLHYWAADTVTHGPESEWGEHEIDYVLLIKADVEVFPNPEEVDDVKYVTLSELREMMKPSSGLLWSPWFRILVERFLVTWWSDLDVTLSTDQHVDLKSIHRFDPPAAHMGGKGHAGPYLGSMATAAASSTGDIKKQGAYGKIKTHSESVLSQVLRVGEVAAALRVKFFSPFKSQKIAEHNEDLAFCDHILGSVSRSFAAVIRQLPDGLCVETVVFYLVLRALDTVEDDMEAFEDPKVKIAHLQTFYETALEDPKWCMTGVGKGDEAKLLEHFYRVVKVFKSLRPGMQAVIKDITKRMGYGMAEYVGKDLGQGTVTLADYDKYCHYVAGLVGEGLTRMFSESGLEDKELAERTDISNSMGLFLQKTNIIRDYLEDYIDGRAFWPQEVWKLYSVTGSLGDFAQLKHREKALQCLNHLVANALVHVPDCLEYLSRLHTSEVFKFCAIPQVMAIATLDKVFNNEDVFTGVVKIRKGLACKLILEANNMDEVYACFRRFSASIVSRVDPSDPNASRTLSLCRHIDDLCTAKEQRKTYNAALLVNVTVVPAVMAACAYYLRTRGADSLKISSSSSTADLAVWGLLFAAVFSLLAYSTASIVQSPFASNSIGPASASSSKQQLQR